MSGAQQFSNKEEALSVSSEHLLASKRDRCLSNLVVNGALGFCLGVGASALLFRSKLLFKHEQLKANELSAYGFLGRTWPLFLATGFGFGTAFADCQRAFHMGFSTPNKKD
ncbi:Mitochondrial inner membrane organizing system component [Entomophthora muscae]|uniref:Mitochondrial inner membrane organizing system component n=1 Tax=Entomophthora muscae TaxID=34485 RepID=A0ACC2SY23_9FUNG|nr:Mitochondrial inner membrane organizing system component [Entomophthora muscae]